MQRILIIEDEQLSASRLMRFIADIDDTIEIVGPVATVEEVIEVLSSDVEFDFLFSDIRLMDRLVFEAFNEVMPSCPVIFVTAYDEYALTAFRNNGIDYLLKPIYKDDVAMAIDKARTLGRQSQQASISAVSRELKCYRERILVSSGDELIPLKTSDIYYIRKEENRVVCYSRCGDSYRLAMGMGEIEEQLSPDTFFRLNRQYIAHIDGIRKISYFFGSKLVVRLLGCDEQVVVSRERSTLFKQWLDR